MLRFICFLLGGLLAGAAPAAAQLLQQRLYGPAAGLGLLISVRGGGYLLAGREYATAGNQATRLWLLRLNAQGDTLWTRKYRLPGFAGPTGCRALCENAAGQVLVLGDGLAAPNTTQVGTFRMLLNTQGDTLWTQRTFAGIYDGYTGAVLDPDGYFVVTGSINSLPQLQKLSAGGQVLATTPLVFSSTDIGFPIKPFLDNSSRGGYWVPLHAYNGRLLRKFVHVTPAGVRDQDVPLYDIPGQTDRIYDVQPIPGGGYLACLDGRLARLTPQLDTVWTRSSRGSVLQVRLLPGGEAVGAGDFSTSGGTRVYLSKWALNGQLLRDTVLASAGGASQYTFGLALEPGTGNYAFSGWTTRTPTVNASQLFFGLLRNWRVTSQREARARVLPLAAWPNPVGAERQLTLRAERRLRGELLLRDELGRLVRRWPALPEATAAGQALSLAGLPAGLYLLTATDADGRPYVARVLCQ